MIGARGDLRRSRAPPNRRSRRPAGQHRGGGRLVSSSSPAASAASRVRPAARQASRTASTSRSRASGRWNTLPVDARTALPLCGSTVSPASSTASATGRVGHPDHGAGVARVGDAGAARRPGSGAGQRDGRRDVEQVADGHDALRRHRVRQRAGGLLGHRDDPHPGGPGGVQQVGVPLGAAAVGEQLVHTGRGGGERLADRLRPFHEEPPGPVAAGAAQQLAGGHDARRALGSGRCLGRCRCDALRPRSRRRCRSSSERSRGPPRPARRTRPRR